MGNPLSKTPFLYLLVPLLIGIVLQYYIKISYLSIVFLFFGIAAMLFSYFIPKDKEFDLRWIFGFGTFSFIIGFGIFITGICQQQVSYNFSDDAKIYRAVIADSPQEKSKTTAYKVYIPSSKKQILCYFEKDSLNIKKLLPGREFIFYGKIQPFSNLGIPDFDYANYMYNQGYSGSVYLAASSWKLTDKEYISIRFTALKYRQKILDFYDTLGLNSEEYAILSALTLGYQDILPEDIKQAFRTTGTIHVLSVSGLHVGIICLMISFLLSFIHRSSKYYYLKPLLIIFLLSSYAFITGLSPSVVRASFMLSLFCVGELIGLKSFSMHSLFIAAFFMLLINPLLLFDIGFQLSFVSVFFILFLHPQLVGLLHIKNLLLRWVCQLFTLSIVAQLGTFPICLYYFGTFPTYFFITNLLIVPLVSLIMYSAICVVIVKVISMLLPEVIGITIYSFSVTILHSLMKIMIEVIKFFENLPFASLQNLKITKLELFLIFVIIIILSIIFIYKKYKYIFISLIAVFILLNIHIYNVLFDKQNILKICNSNGVTFIDLNVNNSRGVIQNQDLKDGYKLLELSDRKVLILSENLWENKESDYKYKLDYLILLKDTTFCVDKLSRKFLIKLIVLDPTFSKNVTKRLTKECKKLGITYYDISQKREFPIIF